MDLRFLFIFVPVVIYLNYFVDVICSFACVCSELDIVPAVVTFVSCLMLRLELGIVIGIGVNLVFLLYASARPSVRVSHAVSAHGVEHVVATVDRSLAFPSAEFVRRALRKAAPSPDTPLVVDATHVHAADFTAAKVPSSSLTFPQLHHVTGLTLDVPNVACFRLRV